MSCGSFWCRGSLIGLKGGFRTGVPCVWPPFGGGEWRPDERRGAFQFFAGCSSLCYYINESNWFLMFNSQLKKVSFSLQPNERVIDFSYSKNQGSEQFAEGQLAVDVAQTDTELIVVAAMAGTRPENIELHLHNDLLTIRGERLSPIGISSEHFNQECYWGKFSRSIILPVDVKADLAQAQYSNGVLTLRLPKAYHGNNIPIMVVED
jgi:HSP20 family molecular chaperone IbpA